MRSEEQKEGGGREEARRRSRGGMGGVTDVGKLDEALEPQLFRVAEAVEEAAGVPQRVKNSQHVALLFLPSLLLPVHGNQTVAYVLDGDAIRELLFGRCGE
eukprot:766466-Hanusia_phi.AAC.4